MRRLGSAYKVRLALAQLQIPYQLVEVDILRGESRTSRRVRQAATACCFDIARMT
jgi:glutathione S-transferase